MRERIWLVVACLTCVAGAGAPHAEAVILINEVLADPAALSGDANRDGTVSASQDEFVELVNTSADPVALTQWSLSDLVQMRHVFVPTASIPSYGFFVIFGGGAPQGFAPVATASSGTLSLNNTGDTLTLRDASGLLIDTFTYGAEGGMDVSLTRSPDATGAFVKHNTINGRLFSPGATVDGLAGLLVPSHDPIAPDATADEQRSMPDLPSGPIVPEPASCLLLGLGVLGQRVARRYL